LFSSCHRNDAILVNGKGISFERLSFELEHIFTNNPELSMENRMTLILDIAESLAVNEALVQKAKQLELLVSDKEIENSLSLMQTQSAGDTRDLYSIWGYRDYAEKENNADVIPQILRNELERQLLIEKLFVHEIRQSISIPEQEIKDYYEVHKDQFFGAERIKVSQIFLEGTNDKTLQKAKQIYSTINNENDFITAAKRYSEANYNLGYIKKGELDPAFDSIAFNMNEHTISEPFISSFGTHIIYVKEKQQGGQATYEDSRAEILEYLKDMLFYPEKQEYINIVKNESEIVYNRKIIEKLAGSKRGGK
jgi:parvulin-like peptidyl-prolyl isomerase